ncbi:MAG: MFS transporter [Peptostreptococcaceae bacterium]
MEAKNKWGILFTVVIITFMSTLDSSIVNVALPVMNKDLGVSMGAIEWVVTSYLITICSTILFFGRIGDTKGKTKIFKLGIIIFTFGSLLCGLSNNLIMLIISRIIQATGAAAAMATNQGIITESFPIEERGRALGLMGTFVALGTMVGPTVGGMIVSVLKWNYIFLINIPIGAIAYVISIKTLPKYNSKSNVALDYKGIALFTIAIIMLFSSIILGQSISYANTFIVLAFFISITLLAIFIKIEKKMEYPLLDINIFKNKLFTVSIICGFTSFVAISGTNIIMPFYLQDALKLSPGITGLIMTVSPIILGVLAPISGYLSDKFECEKITFIGLVVLTIGLLLMSRFTIDTPIWLIVLFLAIMSAGSAMFQSPNNSLIMSTVPRDKLGIAGSINSLVRNLGMISGISLSTTLLYSRMSSKIGYKVLGYVEGRSDVFIYGMNSVYTVVALICLIVAILTLIRLLNKKKA